MTALPGPGLAEEHQPAPEARLSEKKQNAAEILQWMASEGLLLKPGQQAWIPGGYLGMSKSWG
jgi:hypothetical protein